MRTRKKIGIVIGITGLVAIALMVAVACVWHREIIGTVLIRYAMSQSQQRRVLLLCKTDHEDLLKAGREILSHGQVKKRLRQGQGIAGNFHIPTGVQIPQAILDLQPQTVLIDDSGYLLIEMHGGTDHFGVRIYPEGVNESRPLFHGGRKLLEGLVYYDEGYSFNTEYDKVIDKLINGNK